MALSFAALLFRPTEVPDLALSRGFAVALGGWEVPAPRLDVTPLPGVHGFCVAFYASGARLPRGAEEEEIDHARELFEDELSPAVAVLDAAAELGHAEATLYALVFSEDPILDDGWRFDPRGFARRFVREGESGVEAGHESPGEGEVEEVDHDAPDDATDEELSAALDAAMRPLRGSTYLSSELRAPVLPALMGALYADLRRVEIRLVAAGAEAIAFETHRLLRALGRVSGRGAFEPAAVRSVEPPASYRAFTAAYDWEDPADPHDLFRGLAIGAIDGTLRFLRPAELAAATLPAGLYPLAKLLPSALGSTAVTATLALAADGDALVLVRADGGTAAAGPTFGELLRYLSLGWSTRTDAEEDLIGALMLRARLRADAR